MRNMKEQLVLQQTFISKDLETTQQKETARKL